MALKYTDFDSEVYRVVPESFIDIANFSRIDSGYRLLMRCVRHVMDFKLPTMKESRFVKNNDGKVMLILENDVPASMRSNIYKTACAIDEDGKLVACRCSCQCGSEKNERVTCVHILPLAYQLSLFMVSCLAENILLELSALMNSSMIEESFSKEEKVCIKKFNIVNGSIIKHR